MAEVKWTKQSLDDINNIAEYIAADSEKFASIQVEKFFERAAVIERYPEVGKIVPEVGREDIREIISGNYRIINKILSQKRIDILTVHHAARLLASSRAGRRIIRRK